MTNHFLYDVFLSHNSKDKPRVRNLAERLEGAGLRVWFDEWNIQPGDIISLKVDEGLEQSRVLVLCLSPNALDSDWVTLERTTAVHRDPVNKSRRFVPLLLADCELSDSLRRYKYVDFRDEADSDFKELLGACRPDRNLRSEMSSRTARTVKDSPTAPIKVIPATDNELALIRKDFKFYSPAHRSVKTAPLPTLGEQWKLERTLPSGLVLLLNDTSFIADFKNFMKFKLFGVMPRSDFDERPYLYNVPKFHEEDPGRSIQQRTTISLAWHPTKPLLATAGDGNIPRIWDVETGRCETKRTFWHTASPAEMLAWSADGELFISGTDVVDGRTGESVCDAGVRTYFRYSVMTYNSLRWHNASFRGASHLSSTYNFTPWRPRYNQVTFENFDNNLVLQNGRTGEIERVIDCDVGSQIVDFAWHPKGRFVAVAFEEHNIRIIDVDQLRIIDDLSVRRLTGWSPDGRMLVARKEEPKDEFVCWNALETREQAMPERMKKQLWFMRFSSNISADGLRFVGSERDDKRDWRTRIYSVSSGEMLATLPGHIGAALWSPVDGGVLATCEGSETSIWRM